MKKIAIIILISSILIILIYNKTKNNNLDIMVIGDGISIGETYYGNISITYNYYLKEKLSNLKINNYDMTYAQSNFNMQDLQNILINNNTFQDISIKNRIKNSEIIIIHVGQEELINYNKNYISNEALQDFLSQFEYVMREIRKINNKSIYVVGYYNTSKQDFDILNKNTKLITNKYLGTFIDINKNINYNDCLDLKCNYLNYQAHKKIYNLIYNIMKKDDFIIKKL